MKLVSTLLASSLGLLVVACGGEKQETAAQDVKDTQEAAGEHTSLSVIINGDHRAEKNKSRDQYRHPQETLEFFGLEPGMTVVEIWPGGGWYTEIIAPFLKQGGGVYYAAGFDPEGASERGLARIASYKENFVGNPDLYGEVRVTAFSAKTGPIAPASSADMVLTFRNVHNWMKGEFTTKAFQDFYDALKPGGVLGVVEHRLPTSIEQDAKATSGYVHQSYVIELAKSTGFELVEVSEINANPKDTANHPFGVWTLPPVSRKAAYGEKPDPNFDSTPYQAIGESDRMTLKFRKPITADGALLE